MKKKNFAMLVFGTVGGLLFSVGLCMCLLPQWNVFQAGVICTGAGLVFLLALLMLAGRGRAKVKTNWKLVGKISYGVLSVLVLGVGMCMVMVWDLLLGGIVTGIVGVVMLLCLIPMCIGLK